MNKQLIEAMAKKTAAAIGAFTGMPDWSELKFQEDKDCLIEIAEQALKAIHDAGFVVVPKEPTEAMDDAGDKHVYSEGGYSTDVIAVWKAMLQAAQEEISHVEKTCATCKHEQHVHCNSATDCVNNSLWEGK